MERCRDVVVSRYIVHHISHTGVAKPGQKVAPDSLSGYDPQNLLGRKSKAMTETYLDDRGIAWIDVAAA